MWVYLKDRYVHIKKEKMEYQTNMQVNQGVYWQQSQIYFARDLICRLLRRRRRIRFLAHLALILLVG